MGYWLENDSVAQEIKPIDMLPKLTATAVEYVCNHKGSDSPFFLYVPWNSPHSPVVPSKQWQGKSGLNTHADFVMQTDDAFGQVINALKETGQFDNTLIICSSDNGTSAPTSHMDQLIKKGHYPSGLLRGSKSDIWDGGHRVPFIISWANVIKQPRQSNALIGLTDIMATLAEIVDYKLPNDAAEDSISFLDVMNGAETSKRTDVIHHSIEGHFAVRQADWKLIRCPGSGGWSKPTTKDAVKQLNEGSSTVQLYNMATDVGEQTNLASSNPDKVTKLTRLLKQQIDNGRSTLGPTLKNDVPIVIDKWKK